MSKSNILIYLLRKDLRVADNPILHHLSTTTDHGFTHLLPVYVFPAHQIEISGFLRDGEKSPYPEARSQVGGYWRCGPHRAKFIGEAVWNLKESLETLGSGLVLRAGKHGDILQQLIEGLREHDHKVGAVWMTGEESSEEKEEEADVATICEQHDAGFRLWADEKYFVDDRDLHLEKPADLPDVFTTYRKSTEPLRERPRATLSRPESNTLPAFPDAAKIPDQTLPFTIPDSLETLLEALIRPVKEFIPNLPSYPDGGSSAHPFKGGEDPGLERLNYLVVSGIMLAYKDTRNGLLGADFSTKLSAFLVQGCITARQIHEALVAYEDGTNSAWKDVDGYGKGENDGTKAVRFELLWRDYMRLCTRKFEKKLFRREGFRGDDTYKSEDKRIKWKSASRNEALPNQDPNPAAIAQILERFHAGTTGMGLIDASQRELIHTGYTSNRARQNVASFLAKHLGIDWRYGAEYYEMILVDYDVSSNWANWQYVAGVGNDPRGEARIFNPVKQAFDYDKDGSYVRMWVPEVAPLEKLENVYQAWTASKEDLEMAGLADNIMVTDPIKRINFSVEGKPKTGKRPFVRRRGNGGGRGGQGPGTGNVSGNPPYGNSGGNGSSGQSVVSDHASQGHRHHNHPQQYHHQQRSTDQYTSRPHNSHNYAWIPEGPRGGHFRGARGGTINFRGGRGFGNGQGGIVHTFQGQYSYGPPPMVMPMAYPPQHHHHHHHHQQQQQQQQQQQYPMMHPHPHPHLHQQHQGPYAPKHYHHQQQWAPIMPGQVGGMP